jgi:type II secretory ATPase GspE/PulE/Tfp pilus assembly ATPase PilB-like protein
VLEDANIADKAGAVFKKGVGCSRCHNSGFLGRMGVYEVMEVTPGIKRLIHHSRPAHELRTEVGKSGGLTLRQEGVLVALAGKTSLEEVLRVTQDDGEVVDDATDAGKTPPHAKEAA